MKTELRDTLTELTSRGAVRSALAVAVWRLAVHPTQWTRGKRYTELSISYVSKVAEVSLGSAYTAWHIARGIFQWERISIRETRERSIVLRTLDTGQRYGQHLIFSEQVRKAAIDSLDLVTPILLDIGIDPGASVDETVEWSPIEITSRRAARCPYHDDRTPSMIWNPDGNGRTGLGVCMVCRDSLGRHLCALVERDETGSWRAKLSKKTRFSVDSRLFERIQVHIHTPPPPPSPLSTIEVDLSLPRSHRSGSILLGKLDAYGNSRRPSRMRDLLDVLRHAESSSGDADSRRAWNAVARAERTGEDHRSMFADSLVSLDEFRVGSYEERIVRGRSFVVPSRFFAVARRWVLFDLDRLDRALVIPSEIERFTDRVRSICENDSLLEGSFAIVRTSSRGVQVWARLAESVDPNRFTKSVAIRNWLRGVGREVLDSLGCGGILDESSFERGRYGRRPGWRIGKDGMPYRATMIAEHRNKIAHAEVA